MKESGQDLSYFDPYTNKKYIPYVIEPSVGLNRLFLAALNDAYTEIETPEGKRTILAFKPNIAPIKVAVLPIVKKLAPEAMKIYDMLAPHFVCEYDEAGAIGKRYYRFDEIGTPLAIAVDGENFAKNQVTVRHRDTGKQDIVAFDQLVEYVRAIVER
jgi:glycyl-tRNA synthetase